MCQEINGIESYIHIRGAFSVARFDLPGNARALHSGTSNRIGSTFFLFVCIQSFLLTVKKELLAKKHLKMKKLFTMRCMLIALFTVMNMAANAEVIEYSTDDGFKYKLDTEAKTAELAKFRRSQTEVVIPENVTYNDVTYSVTSLGDECFNGCSSLTSIDIPSSVTSLGDYCFYECSSLTSIDIPSSVTSLGKYCFYYCSSLTSVTIPSSVTSLGDNCFSYCSSLTSVTIPSSVTSLGDNCFTLCSSLTSVTIPSSVTSLGHFCFYKCLSLTSITIPSSVTSLGHFCFDGCSSLTSITIPSSVTSLGRSCFDGCSSLASIDIPSSVTSLGDACFWNCSSLKTVTCEIATPIDGNFFSETPIDQATLYVLEASLDAYKTTNPWSGFGKILPITSTGINYNTANKEVTIDAVYDLDGKRSNGTSRGLNIIRMSDGTTRKVMK